MQTIVLQCISFIKKIYNQNIINLSRNLKSGFNVLKHENLLYYTYIYICMYSTNDTDWRNIRGFVFFLQYLFLRLTKPLELECRQGGLC